MIRTRRSRRADESDLGAMGRSYDEDASLCLAFRGCPTSQGPPSPCSPREMMPGMNAAIRAVTKVAASRGVAVWGMEMGYDGLIDGKFRPLTRQSQKSRSLAPVGEVETMGSLWWHGARLFPLFPLSHQGRTRRGNRPPPKLFRRGTHRHRRERIASRCSCPGPGELNPDRVRRMEMIQGVLSL